MVTVQLDDVAPYSNCTVSIAGRPSHVHGYWSQVTTSESFQTLQQGLCYHIHVRFLADRTNGRAYAALLHLSSSSSVCLSVTLCIAALYADSLHTRDTGQSW